MPEIEQKLSLSFLESRAKGLCLTEIALSAPGNAPEQFFPPPIRAPPGDVLVGPD